MTRSRLSVAGLAALLVLLPLLPAAAGGAGDGPDGASGTAALAAPAAYDAAARAAVAALPRATAVNDADGNKLFDGLDAAFAAAGARRLPVIVSFTQAAGTAAGVRAVEHVAPAAVVRRTFTIIPALAGDLTQTEAIRLAALPEVRQVELDADGTLELDTATEVMGAAAVVDDLGITGSTDGDHETATTGDVGIAVLDTGFHTAHADLDGKLVAWRDFGTGNTEPYDPNGHGTHVASIAAGWGRGSDPSVRGVAPGASVIGIKIDGGGNTTSNAIAGYEWIVDSRAELNIRVATISFGFGTATDGTTALERSVDATWDAGVVAFKSNGNSGPGLGTMTVPAAARGILAIGSLLDPFGAGTSKYGFTLSTYSSRGPTSDGRVKPDLVAPGESIRAASPTASGYATKSGTSMASPFAAGTAALMIAANPALQPDEVRDVLFATAQDRGAPGADNDYGNGRIRVWEAVAAASAMAGAPVTQANPTVAPDHDARTGTAALGTYETTFAVTDLAFPVAATVLVAEGPVIAVEITDPSGAAVGSATARVNTGASRQHHFTFRPTAVGTYRVRVVTVPGSPVVVDLSHSTAPPPPD